MTSKTIRPRHWTKRSRKSRHRRRGFFQKGNKWNPLHRCLEEREADSEKMLQEDVPSASNDIKGMYMFFFFFMLYWTKKQTESAVDPFWRGKLERNHSVLRDGALLIWGLYMIQSLLWLINFNKREDCKHYLAVRIHYHYFPPFTIVYTETLRVREYPPISTDLHKIRKRQMCVRRV